MNYVVALSWLIGSLVQAVSSLLDVRRDDVGRRESDLSMLDYSIQQRRMIADQEIRSQGGDPELYAHSFDREFDNCKESIERSHDRAAASAKERSGGWLVITLAAAGGCYMTAPGDQKCILGGVVPSLIFAVACTWYFYIRSKITVTHPLHRLL